MGKAAPEMDVLVQLQTRPPDDGTFICIPQAGSGTAQFKDFAEPLRECVSVWAARFPGWEARIREPPLRTISEMASALLEPIMSLDTRSIVLLGHCSGALVAFELAHLLEDVGFAGSASLAVSAQAGPPAASERPLRPASVLTIAELTEQLRALGGTPEPILSNAEMMKMLAPRLRADFEAVERYSSSTGRRQLAMPILAMRGRADEMVTRADLLQWSTLTRGAFILEEVDGAHFFLAEQRLAVHRLLLELLERGRPSTSLPVCRSADEQQAASRAE
jgi:medium-chain acyl-[acyl-carrier-protein] hydrolase